LKISVTFTEFEGDKKVKSLPYTTIVTADGKNPKSVVKMGSRVPVYTGKDYGMPGVHSRCHPERRSTMRFSHRAPRSRDLEFTGAVRTAATDAKIK